MQLKNLFVVGKRKSTQALCFVRKFKLKLLCYPLRLLNQRFKNYAENSPSLPTCVLKSDKDFTMGTNITQTLKFLSFWMLTLLAMPLICALLLLIILWKLAVVSFVWLFRCDLGRSLCAVDSALAQDEFYNDSSYGGNLVYFIVNGNLLVENVRSRFQETVLYVQEFQKLSQIPVSVCGYYFWKTVPVDLIKHIREDNTGFSAHLQHENQLHDKLANLMISPFSRNCPLWEIVILNGYKYNQSVLAFRLHHALGDGYSQNHLVDRMIKKSSTYSAKEKNRSFPEKIHLLLSAPYKILSIHKEHIFQRHLDSFRQRKVSMTAVLSTTWIPLEDMKIIRRYTKTHFATIGMSMLGGALRRYFMETQKPSDLPEFITFGHSLPKSGHPISTLVNHWKFGMFKIPIKMETALERLKESEQIFQNLLDDEMDTLSSLIITGFGALFPPTFIRIFLRLRFGLGSIFTSLPGYEYEALLFGEYKVRRIAFVTGLQCPQFAITAAMYSHAGAVSFSVFANKDIISDQNGVDRITQQYLHLELEELLNACSTKSKCPNNVNPQTDIV